LLGQFGFFLLTELHDQSPVYAASKAMPDFQSMRWPKRHTHTKNIHPHIEG
jgi:hypothetical protein